ncbi:uncharacterized protein Z518_03490 [Rhinocladiella mackenziei CBS 650.93]|uniref:Rhodopsin domain-containing protein n=1 Tax=Rhinocladiella mackenziei CBS 650.93 TaxID=1442369 RepID=A0A0D2HE40_9EURO|nr:uncharacterized protein Z518_03490 [Rhinocladiella mackenziei CBS 650.93]KIX08833.1 hypothetical protein Z518_03490 [Rhinocladiella mackenziei CBS 650.93]
MAETPPRSGSQGPVVLAIAISFGAITLVVISLRLLTKVLIHRHVGLDDYLIVCAALLTWAFMVMNILCVSHGMGHHIEVVMARGPENFSVYMKEVYASSVFYNASLGFIKCSFLALYARLGDKQLRRLSFVVATIVACSASANVLVCIFQCRPIRAAWDTNVQNAKCVNINAFYLANAGTNIGTDLLTYLLPMRLVWHLQLPRKQKIAVGVMLCLGLFACVSSIIRITFIPAMLTSTDATYVISPPFYWSVIEINIGIWAASVPSFKLLVKRFLPRLLQDGSSRRRQAYDSGPLRKGYTKDGSGFNKLSNHNAVHMASLTKDGTTIVVGDTPSGWSNEHKVNDSPHDTYSVQGAESNNDRRTSTDSQSSRKQMVRPTMGVITRTTEVAITSEGGRMPTDGRRAAGLDF